MEATMRRGCLGLLILLGMAQGQVFSQSPPPPATLAPSLNAAPATPSQPACPSCQGTTSGQQPGTPANTKAGQGQTTQGQTTQGQTGQKDPCSGQNTAQTNPNQAPSAEMQNALLKRTHYGPCENFWFGGGLLLWWTEPTPGTGPLVTTGGPSSQGILGIPGTQVLNQTHRTNFGTQPGIWLEAGAWLDKCHQWGIGAAGFLLERQGQGQAFTSDGTGAPLLAMPYTNAITGVPTSQLISTPGGRVGSIDISQNTQFAGWEVNLLRNLEHTPGWNFQVLAGFRYLDLYENLNIGQTSTLLQPIPFGFRDGINGPLVGLPAGATQNIADRFTTRNQAYLGQVGAQVAWCRGPFFLELIGKVGMGPNHERVRILGSTTTLMGGAPIISQGGLLAVPATPNLQASGNFGTHTTNWFVIVPEIGATLGMNVGQHVRVSAGYSFLYINSVARPGSQVNTTINPALVPSSPGYGSPSGPGQPHVLTKQDDFWVHGVRFMVELRF